MSKNILFIVTKASTGGAQKFVAEQIEVIKKHSDFNFFLATNEQGWLSEQVDGQVNDILLDKNIEKRHSIAFLVKLHAFIRRHKIDLVICNSANGGLYGRLAALMTKCKSIYVSHGWSSVYNGGRLAWVLNKVENGLSRIGSSVLCISDNDYRTAVERVSIPTRKLKLINNSMLPMKPRAGGQCVAGTNSSSGSDAGNSSRITKILAVARLCAPKRIDLLVRAMKQLPHCELTIVGGGPNFQETAELIEELGVTNIELKGEIKGFDQFNKYDLFTLVSDSEGLPFSAMEAMSFGLPLVLSDVGGCGTLVDGNGILVKNNVEEIANGIEICIENKFAFSKRSKEIFDSRFNLENTYARYRRYYDDVMAMPKPQFGFATAKLYWQRMVEQLGRIGLGRSVRPS